MFDIYLFWLDPPDRFAERHAVSGRMCESGVPPVQNCPEARFERFEEVLAPR